MKNQSHEEREAQFTQNKEKRLDLITDRTYLKIQVAILENEVLKVGKTCLRGEITIAEALNQTLVYDKKIDLLELEILYIELSLISFTTSLLTGAIQKISLNKLEIEAIQKQIEVNKMKISFNKLQFEKIQKEIEICETKKELVEYEVRLELNKERHKKTSKQLLVALVAIFCLLGFLIHYKPQVQMIYPTQNASDNLQRGTKQSRPFGGNQGYWMPKKNLTRSQLF